ncbi:MAG: hypothetical protein BWY71_01505 [Planctomycetes bacterium ADurb.Bin412]|nr:MAG: hypothetical protein BWY71_01505 [Planctomycetes bacterium ADurb.Bin412]
MDGALFDDGIAVAVFRGIIDFCRQLGQLFKEMLGDQAGVVGRAAGGDNDAFGADEFAAEAGDAAQMNLAGRQIEAAAQAGLEGMRLFEDFLGHVMLEAGFFDGFERVLNLFDFGGNGDVVDGGGAVAVGMNDGHFIVAKIDGLLGMLDNGGGVGSDDKFAVPYAENQGTAPAGGDE